VPGIDAKTLSSLAVVGAGISLALQQVLNARLRVELASAWWAGFVSYCVGMLVMLAAVVVFGEARLTGAALARVSWMSWMGGFFGAVFIGTAILTVPRLGAATVLALVVVGQMIGSMVFDQIGLFGLIPQPITPIRIAGAVLLVLGVVLVRV
jgi:transporter family-2 protein